MYFFLTGSSFWLKIKEWFIDTFSEFKLGNIITLLVGIFFGFAFFGLFYCLLVLVSYKRRVRKVYKPQDVVTEYNIKELIDKSCISFKDEYTSCKFSEKGEGLKKICFRLIQNIARLYYPDSKHPEKEITIDEMFLLVHYITSRVDEILNARLLKPFRKYRLAQIQNFLETKKKVEETKVIKAAKKAQAPKIVLAARAVLNAINPAFWVSRGIVNPVLGLIYNKVMLVIIRIVGEEAGKIYSKQVISEEDEIASLMDEIDNEEFKEDE